MEGVEGRSIDNSRLVADEHTLCIIEGINDHSSGIAQANLEDRLAVSAPPAFTYGSMVVAEFGKMPNDWESARNFWNAFYSGNIGGC